MPDCARKDVPELAFPLSNSRPKKQVTDNFLRGSSSFLAKKGSIEGRTNSKLVIS